MAGTKAGLSAGKKAAGTKKRKAARRTAVARKAANTKAMNAARRSLIGKRASRTKAAKRKN
jgi:hypothetical protein